MTAVKQLAPPADSVHAQNNFWSGYDLVLVCTLIAVGSDMLNRTGLATPVWLLCYAMTLARIALSWQSFYTTLAHNGVYLLYPAVCIASTFWSRAPSWTLDASIQLTMTILFGVFVGWRYSLRRMTVVLFWVLFIAVMLSLVHWATGIFPWERFSNAGGLVGIFTQKNMLGQRGLYCAIAALAIVLLPSRSVKLPTKLAAVAALGIVLAALLLSRSMTSVVLLPVSLCMLMVLCLHRIPRPIQLFAVLGAVNIIALGPLVMALAAFDPVDFLLGATGKDATLTGRTVLWSIARDLSVESPLLGVGFGAFWEAAEFANARHLIIEAGAVNSRSFHNFIVEIMVAVGLVGLFCMLILLGTSVVRLVRCYTATRSVAAACGLTLVSVAVILSLVETGLYRQHEILLMAVVMYGVAAQTTGAANRVTPRGRGFRNAVRV